MSRATFHHGDLENAVLRATAEALQTQRAEEVSVRAIARQIGVSPSAVYRHFADRDALLAAVASETYARFAGVLRAAYESVPGPGPRRARRRLAAMARAYVRFAHAHPPQFALMFTPGARAASGPEAYALLERAVDDLRAAGAIRDDPRAAPLVWSATHGLAALSLEGAVGSSLDDALADADRLMRVVVRGLAPAG